MAAEYGEPPLSKVEDVLEGIRSFGGLVSIMAAAAGGNPLLLIMAAEWMSTLIHKLVEWGTITKAEADWIVGELQKETEARKEKEQKPADKELVWTVGI